MIIWAIVPAKDPALAKSRLSPVLHAAARSALSLRLLRHTLEVLSAVHGLTQCVVISTADAPLRLAAAHHCLALPEDAFTAPGDGMDAAVARRQLPAVSNERAVAEGPLNHALTQAAEYALHQGADAVLILPADLPYLQPARIQEILQQLAAPAGMVIVPDRAHLGTNALLVAPPRALPFSFGHQSFAAHLQAAQALGLPSTVVEDPQLALDLDAPEDLSQLIEQARNGDAHLAALAGVPLPALVSRRE